MGLGASDLEPTPLPFAHEAITIIITRFEPGKSRFENAAVTVTQSDSIACFKARSVNQIILAAMLPWVSLFLFLTATLELLAIPAPSYNNTPVAPWYAHEFHVSV